MYCFLLERHARGANEFWNENYKGSLKEWWDDLIDRRGGDWNQSRYGLE